MADFLAPIKVLNLPQDICFKGTTAEIIQQIADSLVASVPGEISNVVVGNSEPTSPDTALWVRQDNSGTFLGLYVFSGGSWVLLVQAPIGWTTYDISSASGSGAMIFTVSSSSASYAVDQNGTVTVEFIIVGDVSGTPTTTIDLPLPVPLFPGSNFSLSCKGTNSGNIDMWVYSTGTDTITWAIPTFVNFTAGEASIRTSFSYRGDV